MRFSQSQEFPADIATLWRLFARRSYVQRKYLALDGRAPAIERFEAQPDAIEVRLDRELALSREHMPGWMRAAAPPRQPLNQHSRWRRVDAHRVQVAMEVAAPGAVRLHASADGELAETSHGHSRLTLRWQVQCEAPLVAGAIERFFAARLRDAMAADHAFTLGELARRRPRLARA